MLNDKLRKQLPKPTEDTSSGDDGSELCLCREESDPRNYWADEATPAELMECDLVDAEIVDWMDEPYEDER